MKTKLISIGIATLLAATMCIPVFATSSSFGFTMSNRVVDGSENGAYHSLAGGTYPSISGSMIQVGGQTQSPDACTIYATLLNKTSGNSFGTVTLGRPDLNGHATDFSGRFSKKTGGGSKYYLIVYRNQSDGRVMSGTGTLKD